MSSSDFDRLRRQLATHLAATTPPGDCPPALTDGSWPDINYAEDTRSDWNPRFHLQRAQLLALAAYQQRGPAQPALDALAYWVGRDPLSLNWWHNQIGTPRQLAGCLLLLHGSVPAPLLAASLPILARGDHTLLFENGVLTPVRWTGANLLWLSANRLLAGAILGDESVVSGAIAAALGEIRLAGPGEEGIQIDGSFHQHGPLLYNGGYGAAFLDECLFFLGVTHDTRWQVQPALLRLLADFLLDGTRWMLRGSDVSLSCRDREITRSRPQPKSLPAFAAFLAGTGVARAAEIKDFADALRTGRAPGTLSGNHYFYRSDFMVQQDPRAAFTVRMSSVRTIAAECVNDEGLRSHHLADGLTCLRATGEEYRDIFPVWDWQKLPGTTCVQSPEPAPPSTVHHRGSSPLVGGVSDGRHGACAQTLATDTLHARKAWFFGPAGMVCLGAGIRARSAALTTLDQSRLQGPVLHDRAPLPLAPGSHDLADPRWLLHGTWGFLFPRPTRVSLSLGPQTGAWSLIGRGPSDPVTTDVFLATIDHGPSADNAGYAYAVIPAATADTLARLADAPPFVILANDDHCQALWWPADRRLQAVFHTAGTLTHPDGRTLHVDRPCCIQTDPTPALFIAELDQTGAPITVRLGTTETTIHPPTGIHSGATTP
jgi:chondroitin AC lyase